MVRIGHCNVTLSELVYCATEQVFGSGHAALKTCVQPVSRDPETDAWSRYGIQRTHSQQDIHSDIPAELSASLQYLREKSGALPPLHISTKAEALLFTELMMMDPPRNGSAPNYNAMLSEWRNNVDGKTVFPKRACHLRQHYQKWCKMRDRRLINSKCKDRLKAMHRFLTDNADQIALRCSEFYCTEIEDVATQDDRQFDVDVDLFKVVVHDSEFNIATRQLAQPSKRYDRDLCAVSAAYVL